MNIPTRRFNAPRYIQTTLSKTVRSITADETKELILDCFEPFLEDLAEHIEEHRPDLHSVVDEAMAARGFAPPLD
jgi:hypothetical protein